MPDDSAGKIEAFRPPRPSIRFAPAREDGWHERALGEGMHHVGDQQLLMLLLMRQAERHELGNVRLALAQ